MGIGDAAARPAAPRSADDVHDVGLNDVMFRRSAHSRAATYCARMDDNVS
jgi:hypothetical protein